MANNINKLFLQWAANHNIVEKSEGGVMDSANTTYGGVLPVHLVQEMISLGRTQSQWLNSITTKTVDGPVGDYPVTDLNEPVTEGVGENDGSPVSTKAPTNTVSFACKKFKSQFYLSTEVIDIAASGGLGDFEAAMVREFAIAMGNDAADIIMNSDTTLTSATRRGKMLRMLTGVLKQLHTSGNVYNAAGKNWGQGMWSYMLTKMPEKFRNDPGLQWMYNDMVDILWHNSLSNTTGTLAGMRSNLGDAVISSVQRVPPLGKQQNIVNQISSTMGPTAIAPTSVSGTTTVVAVCTTLIATDASAATTASLARNIKITCLLTGVSEVCVPVWTSVNTITTTSTLGQVTVSATASDYVITFADETSVILGNPKGIHLIYWKTMRAFREFEVEYDRVKITNYWRADVKIPAPSTFAINERVRVLPPATW